MSVFFFDCTFNSVSWSTSAASASQRQIQYPGHGWFPGMFRCHLYECYYGRCSATGGSPVWSASGFSFCLSIRCRNQKMVRPRLWAKATAAAAASATTRVTKHLVVQYPAVLMKCLVRYFHIKKGKRSCSLG